MSLSVIGLGMPRTGTLSMKSALEQLGYGRCYHMEEVFAAPRRSKAWASFFSGGPVDWDEVFDGYGAAVDAPACFGGGPGWGGPSGGGPPAIDSITPSMLWIIGPIAESRMLSM